MKKLFLYLLFMVATVVPVFSQAISSKKYDFNLELPSYDSLLKFDMLKDTVPLSALDEANQFRQFDNLEDFIDSMGKNNNLLYGQDQIVILPNIEQIYSLRIMKPAGNYPIKIYEPDSVKNYTLLIKDF